MMAELHSQPEIKKLGQVPVEAAARRADAAVAEADAAFAETKKLPE